MKLTIGDFVVPVIVLGAAGWWGYKTYHERLANPTGPAPATAAYTSGLETMAREHHAVTRVNAALAEFPGPLYTYHLQNLLIDPSGRPVLIEGTIADIARQGDGYVLRLGELPAGPALLTVVLGCDSVTAQALANARPDGARVAVVAQVSSVEKPEFKLAADPKVPDAAPTIQADSGNHYVVRGRCLAFMPGPRAPADADK